MTSAAVTTPELAIAALLVVANAGLTLLIDARLARTLLVSAARAIVQLLLVGSILAVVFSLQSAWLVALVLAVMLTVAGFEIERRQEQPLRGLWRHGLGPGAMLFSTLVVGGAAVTMVHPVPAWDPRVVIPLIGILLGSVMNGVSISLNTFTTAVVRESAAIEAQLALGATRDQALRAIQRQALRSATIPVINQMSAAGIITLPGMMSGQILAGMPALEAAKYQILVLLLLSAGAALGALCTLHAAARRVTDERHRLRIDHLTT